MTAAVCGAIDETITLCRKSDWALIQEGWLTAEGELNEHLRKLADLPRDLEPELAVLAKLPSEKSYRRRNGGGCKINYVASKISKNTGKEALANDSKETHLRAGHRNQLQYIRAVSQSVHTDPQICRKPCLTLIRFLRDKPSDHYLRLRSDGHIS
ncbi:hypothetical protein MJO29_005719 [Puccinia striiformis f. sp. tritici]|nr:hypothetical protein MJO29_005719 [Puccinia striiformis f. sp. tritici]